MSQFNKLYFNLLEGIHDKDRFKAVFVIGPAGAGKSYVIDNIINNGNLKVLDMDQPTEHLLKKHGINGQEMNNLNLSDLSAEDEQSFQKLRDRAREMTYGEIESPNPPTRSKSSYYVEGGLGLIVSGTGKNYDFTKRAIDHYKNAGYDIMMVHVTAPLSVCLAGNRKRARRLNDEVVKETYKDIEDNIPKFQALLGNDFITFDNSQRGGSHNDGSPLAIKVKKFLNRPNVKS